MTLHNVIIHIKSVLRKGKYHTTTIRYFFKKCSYQSAKNNHKIFFYNKIMMKFGKTETAKEKLYAAKETYKNLGCEC